MQSQKEFGRFKVKIISTNNSLDIYTPQKDPALHELQRPLEDHI
jgi:hypothetical protein